MGQCRERALDLEETQNGRLTDNLTPAESRALYTHLLPVLMEACNRHAAIDLRPYAEEIARAESEMDSTLPSVPAAAREDSPAGLRFPLRLRLALERCRMSWPAIAWLGFFGGMLAVDWVCHLLGKPTLTRSIVGHLPWWVTMTFFTWVWIHFASWYWRKP